DTVQELAARRLPHIVLIFEQGTQCVARPGLGQLGLVESYQRLQPVQRLGNAWRLEEVFAAQGLHEGDDLAGKLLRGGGHAGQNNGVLLLQRGVLNPVVQAAAAQRIVDIAGAVGGEDDEGWVGGADGAQLGDSDGVVAEQLEQIRLKLGIGTVQLVNEQDRGMVLGGVYGLQQGTAYQELRREDIFERNTRAGSHPRVGAVA